MTVYLVGTGPGDPELITARAGRLISTAEVVIYDRLIPDGVLELAAPQAELIYAGKEGGGSSVPQEGINALLIERGRAGLAVVRLKGGDPFVFGRGGEEAEALREAGVPFEVVPGVTAGIAAPAYAGIPVTHRDAASAVAFVTGHEDPTKHESAIDWGALATFPGTVVVYMGVRRLDVICRSLQEGGRAAQEPAAVIERGTLPTQRVVHATLGSLAQRSEQEGVRAPAVAVFGDVAGLSESLSWFETPPFAGVKIAVTRARAQASQLAARLRELGAEVLQAPVIRIVPRDGPTPELRSYQLICLTSPNGAHLLFERLAAEGKDARALALSRVAAIGPGTAAALRQHGVIADIVPERFVAEGLIDSLRTLDAARVLIARAADAREALPEALRAAGSEVEVLELYETVAESLSRAQLAALREADYVTFTSSSTVRFFFEAAGRDHLGPKTRIASIGPITSATLRELGLEPDLEASRHDIDGLVEALLTEKLAGLPGPRSG